MDTENIIRLSGPFQITDSFGHDWQINGIRIFDEGYSIIDVYVDLADVCEDGAVHEDGLVIRQIMARLHALGYEGPDFGLADAGLQDERLVVLEAPEAFSVFAATKGWRNLAADYADAGAEDFTGGDLVIDPVSQRAFEELMYRISGK